MTVHIELILWSGSCCTEKNLFNNLRTPFWETICYTIFYMNVGCKIQGLPELVTQKSAVLTSELDVKIWSGTFQKLRLVVKFSFKPPDGIPLLQTEVTLYLSRTVVAWIWRGRTITWPPRSPDLTPLDFSVWGYVKDKVFVPLLLASLEEIRARLAEAAATVCGPDS